MIRHASSGNLLQQQQSRDAPGKQEGAISLERISLSNIVQPRIYALRDFQIPYE